MEIKFGIILLSLLILRSTAKTLPIDKDSALLGGDADVREQLTQSDSLQENKNSTIGTSSIGTLPLPSGYNKLVIPLANVSSSIYVMVSLAIREVLDVDTKGEFVELDTELGVQWIDWEIWKYFKENKEVRERLKSGPEEIILDSEFLRHIWKPDIYIDEMASVERTSLLAKQITLRFLVSGSGGIEGSISFKSRQTLKLRCSMDFHYYPADIQKCTYNLRSYSYPESALFLIWDELRSVFLDAMDDPNFDFQINSVEPGTEYEDLYITSQTRLSETNYSALSFTLEIRRNATYHLVQTYLPSVLLILITWLCFLLPPDMVEARIGISMTTLLTLTAMFSAVREQSPEVSYASALDIWMVFCIFLVFLALVLFTVIYWMRRKLERFQEDNKERHAKQDAIQNQNNQNGDITHNNHDADADDVDEETYKKYVDHSKRYAFWLFAFVFGFFLLTYTIWLFISSDWYSWDPPIKYNAIPLDPDNPDNETNRLFVMKKAKFEPNDTFRITSSEFRWNDIVDDIIVAKGEELEAKNT